MEKKLIHYYSFIKSSYQSKKHPHIMFRTPPESRSIPFNAGPSRRQKNCKCGQIPAECDCNENSETEEDSIEPVSISPPQPSLSQTILPWQSVRRRIDFSVSPPSSPRRIEAKSPSVEVIAHHDAPSAQEAFGECGVCYSDLPARSNHVATICGHLFCVRCFLRWHLGLRMQGRFQKLAL